MALSALLRYGLWVGIAATAQANRRHYRMATTWVPHLCMNTITLLLPDLFHLLLRDTPRSARADAQATDVKLDVNPSVWQMLQTTLCRMVQDDPYYVIYVTPLALGYVLSHPDFNIYKGAWGELEVAGLGLDAIPHATTAFALTTLVHDTASVAASLATDNHAIENFLRWCNRHHRLVSALVLSLVTLAWEAGEYRIYKYELSRNGNQDAINMQWSQRDMVQDCVANTLGWLLATGRAAKNPDS